MADEQVGAFKKEHVTNGLALAQQKSLQTHFQDAVDFGFVSYLFGISAVGLGIIMIFYRNRTAGIGLLCATACVSIAAVVYGISLGSRWMVSVAVAGLAASLALFGAMRVLETRIDRAGRARAARSLRRQRTLRKVGQA